MKPVQSIGSNGKSCNSFLNHLNLVSELKNVEAGAGIWQWKNVAKFEKFRN